MSTTGLEFFDFVVIVAYLITVLAIGFVVSYRRKHADDIFLAGRNLRWPTVGLSIFGTNVSPSMILASCSTAFSSGMVAANFEWLAWWFLMLLAMVFVPHYLNLKVSTMPEFLERRYGRGCREFLSVYALFTTVIVWLAGTLYAGGILLGQIMDWPLWLGVILLITLAASFTVAGGLAAVAVTDAFQVVLIIVGSTIMLVIGIIRVGGVAELVNAIPEDYWHLFRDANDPTYPWPAIVLGCPVLAIWFWCTDQTVVQRVLGARSLKHGQAGALLAGYLKILTPILFFIPGLICLVLFPDLDHPDKAYMTLVGELLPAGLVGLMVAVLIAAFVSTVDSGLNSFSTLFTLDVYCRHFRPDADTREIKMVGRLSMVAAALIAIVSALAMESFAKNLFELLQSIVGYLAPPTAAVFLVGVLWKRATSIAALVTFIAGTVVCFSVGLCELKDFPSKEFWPHFLYLSFYLFVACVLLLVVVSLLTPPPPRERALPTLRQVYENTGRLTGLWILWGVLAVIMASLYIGFN